MKGEVSIPDWNIEHIVGVTPEFIQVMKMDEIKYAKLQKAYKSLYRFLDCSTDGNGVTVNPITQAGHIYVITFVIDGSVTFIPSEAVLQAAKEAFEGFEGVSIYPTGNGKMAISVTIESVYGTSFKKRKKPND